ncbi:sensor domain-containing protein [Mycolicibacterium sp. S2-37]|uniref:sensor domain-containing protein n=1 Tax=Mycolicibacterium sp. S2-37 TaxID=2810297 RepID=UPI001A94A942|nr:sensor domain-containing protein [Mycolicibacterium sp. S2-37]MBO0678214.1 sensor domain-containing protein [Mycolicibacterium sp. S2-37]
MSRRAGVAVALCCAALTLAGCARTVEGAARPAASALRLLPTEADLAGAIGNGLSTFGFAPFAGGADILPDGFRTDADAAPIACVAITDTAPRFAYADAPVLEAARQSYFTLAAGAAVSGMDAVVVRMASVDAADQLFGQFATQWRQCDGTTVDKRLRGANDTQMTATIDDVTDTDRVLSATVVTELPPAVGRSQYQRALGVRGDTIAEVSLAVTPVGERRGDNRAKAVRAVEAILEKV